MDDWSGRNTIYHQGWRTRLKTLACGRSWLERIMLKFRSWRLTQNATNEQTRLRPQPCQLIQPLNVYECLSREILSLKRVNPNVTRMFSTPRGRITNDKNIRKLLISNLPVALLLELCPDNWGLWIIDLLRNFMKVPKNNFGNAFEMYALVLYP